VSAGSSGGSSSSGSGSGVHRKVSIHISQKVAASNGNRTHLSPTPTPRAQLRNSIMAPLLAGVQDDSLRSALCLLYCRDLESSVRVKRKEKQSSHR
jgi:hypothetical protein